MHQLVSAVFAALVFAALGVASSYALSMARQQQNPAQTLFATDSAKTQDAPTEGLWGDQGDGSFINPIMPGDFSDLDSIRVGADFYAISSTFQYSPAVAILHSRDLVNWTMIGHVVDDLRVLDPELNWDRMNRAGRGVWAGSIRYHSGKFWVYFGTPDQGIYMSTSATAKGPWKRVKLAMAASGWDDPCPFWDDDGQGYLVVTHFAREGPAGTTYNIHLFKMNANGDDVLLDSDHILHQSKGSEANKLYKINNFYYHYFSEVAQEGRVAMMERARSLNGPWEIHQLNHVNPGIDKEPNQGGLIPLDSGKWYFVTHQGRGDWEGRGGVLLPVTWIDAWPILGKAGPDGIGKMIWHSKKPISGYPQTTLFTSDDFDGSQLKPEWEWNYQPRSNMWSLTERRGFLRMHAFQPLRPNDFRAVGNVLTQRSSRTRRNRATVKLDLAGMRDGQESGLAHFADTYATVGVMQDNGIRRLSCNQDGTRRVGPRLRGDTLYLRSTWNFAGRSQFSYSLDGRTYRIFGHPYQLTWGSYRGDRLGIFTVNPLRNAGFVDVDSFSYQTAR